MHQNFLSPKYYPSDEEVRTWKVGEPWLERLIIKYVVMAIESDESRAKLLKFEETLRHECDTKSLYATWQFCGVIDKWYTNWPHLMKVWQKLLANPQVLQYVIGDFQNNIISKATCELHWSWTLWTLWCEYHYVGLSWRIWIGGQYLSYDAAWGLREFLVWTK